MKLQNYLNIAVIFYDTGTIVNYNVYHSHFSASDNQRKWTISV